MLHRCLIALALLAIPLGALGACSHDAAHHASAHRAARTAGNEQATERAHTDPPVATIAHADMDGGAPTAMDQSESAEDLEISRQIRSAVVSDSSLSFSARNCTIITRGAVVTLRGTVTPAESQTIEHHALATPGVAHVDNMFDTAD